MLPSRQVVCQHRSPGCLNTSTKAVEAQGHSSHQGVGVRSKRVRTMGKKRPPFILGRTSGIEPRENDKPAPGRDAIVVGVGRESC